MHRHFVQVNEGSSKDISRIICTCAGHRKCAECSHQIAVAQLLVYFSIEDYVTSLHTVVRVGRPSHYQPAGFVSTQNPVTVVKKTMSFIGTNIAWRFPEFHNTRTWEGKIIGSLISAKPCMIATSLLQVHVRISYCVSK